VEVVASTRIRKGSAYGKGFYVTPGIIGPWQDRPANVHYFAYERRVAEGRGGGVHRVAWVVAGGVLQRCGRFINEGVNRGQVEGGFVQGRGWRTLGVEVGGKGTMLTMPGHYKIPAVGDMRQVFNVRC